MSAASTPSHQLRRRYQEAQPGLRSLDDGHWARLSSCRSPRWPLDGPLFRRTRSASPSARRAPLARVPYGAAARLKPPAPAWAACSLSLCRLVPSPPPGDRRVGAWLRTGLWREGLSWPVCSLRTTQPFSGRREGRLAFLPSLCSPERHF